MDAAELIKLYKHPCFIFNASRVKIEDDEIIDLDSISLDSNEDTWLLSNSKENDCEELAKEKMKHRLDSVSIDGSGDFSRISLSNWDFKEETLSESLLNLLNTTSTNHKRVEMDVVDTSPIDLDDIGNTMLLDKVENLRKPRTPANDFNTFKKPLPKNEIGHLPVSPIVGQEKNFAELSGTAKKKTSMNKSIPISHSTPLPMLRKHKIRTDYEKSSAVTSIDTCPSVSSSASSAEDLHSASEAAVNDNVAEEALDITLKDEASPTFEIPDDNKSTSSSDSRRSSSSSIPRTVLQSRAYSSPTPPHRRLEQVSRINVFSPPRNISSPPRTMFTSPRASSVRKTLYNETTMIKEPSRRAPSLSRLQAPSVNIHEEFVSVVEIKPKDSASKTNAKKPVSHLPRPSTRIPTLRSSVSCTRAGPRK